MRNLKQQLDHERAEARLAKANRDILLAAADALEDPGNIRDVQKVLREEAQNFADDAIHHAHNANVLNMEYNEQRRQEGHRG